ncbi:hypothetical protein [Pseudonocardia sp. ICBG1293]|uniref:hypothetical protein n=1 Tax=Pseudonocardia sp. ICBG1293 TaxID=2844382 RepID=UPI001CCAFFDA|nr:hypothetical protein [Pseudonocardia sp. ICBG1293]
MKKTGLLTATTLAGLLLAAPAAFADTDDHRGKPGGGSGGSGGSGDVVQVNEIDQNRESAQSGLVNVGDVNALNNANVLSCSLNNADIAAGVLGAASNGTDAPSSSECSPGSIAQNNTNN